MIPPLTPVPKIVAMLKGMTSIPDWIGLHCVLWLGIGKGGRWPGSFKREGEAVSWILKK
jgi:hypothetical protein